MFGNFKKIKSKFPPSSFWTALATVAIAVLTGYYVYYASQQWKAMDSQLKVMDNQLKYIQESGKQTAIQTDNLIRQAITQAEATNKLAKEAKRSNNISDNALKINTRQSHVTLTLANPPKLITNGIAIWYPRDAPLPKGYDFSKPLTLVPGQKLEGAISVLNVGSTTAIIGESTYMAWWKGPLPMSRPYAGKVPTEGERLVNNKDKPVTKLESGQYGRFNINTQVPESYDGTKPLYIIGHVIYHSVLKDGTLKTWHNMLFARQYDSCKGYFIPVTDRPDYEGNENP